MNERTRVATLVGTWLRSRVGLAGSSLERYGYALAPLLDAFGRRQLGTVGRLELQLWLADQARDNAAATARLAGKLARTVFREAVLCGALRVSPADGLRLPAARARARTLTVTYEQVRSGLDCSRRVGAPWSYCLSLLLESGLRRGELLHLRWIDISTEGSIRIRPHEDGWVPKAGARIVPFSRRARGDVDGLRLCRRDLAAPLVVGVGGTGRAVGSRLRRRLWWALGEAGLPAIRVHDLRHIFVTHLFETGAPAPVVQALAGHSSLATTQLYSHTAPEGLRAAMGRF